MLRDEEERLRDVTAATPHALYPVTGLRRVWAAPVMVSPGREPPASCLEGGGGRHLASGQPGSRARVATEGGSRALGGGLLAPRLAVRHRWNRAGLEADVTAGAAGALFLSRARRTAPPGKTPGPFLSEMRRERSRPAGPLAAGGVRLFVSGQGECGIQLASVGGCVRRLVAEGSGYSTIWTAASGGPHAQAVDTSWPRDDAKTGSSARPLAGPAPSARPKRRTSRATRSRHGGRYRRRSRRRQERS